MRPGAAADLLGVLLPLMIGVPVAASPALAAARAVGVLRVETAPVKVSPANPRLTVKLSNAGDAPITSIRLAVRAPAGVSAATTPGEMGPLAPGSSTLAEVTLTGSPQSRPASLVVEAAGRSGAVDVQAVTAVELVRAEPSATMTLAGNNRLTDRSPAEIVAVLTNSVDVPAEVTVRALAGPHRARLGGADPGAPLTLTVGARETATVPVVVEARDRLRRGTSALVLIGTVRSEGTEPFDITAARDLDVALAADVLPGALGVTSVLVVPGLVAIWAALLVWTWDRRRLQLTVPDPAARMWDNKMWLFAALAASVLLAFAYTAVGAADLFDTYALTDIGILAAAGGLLGAGIVALFLWWYRARVPLIRAGSSQLAVLNAAARFDGRGARREYRTTGGERGLLVHFDHGLPVLTPRIVYAEVDDVDAKGPLGPAIRLIRAAHRGVERLEFLQENGAVRRPGVCPGAEEQSAKTTPILKYRS